MQFTAQISRTYDYDVVVCGSGSAGFAAALSAARNGSRVAIVEKNGELGGSTTSGLVGPFMTCFDPSGKRQLSVYMGINLNFLFPYTAEIKHR